MNTMTENHTVLVVAGPSGVGKSSLSYQLSRHLDRPLVEADDIHHALEAVTTTESHPWIHFWEDHPEGDEWSVEEILRCHIEVCRAHSPAFAAVIDNHLHTDRPIVLEGDYLLPELIASYPDRVHGIWLTEESVDQYVANFLAREPKAGEQRRRAEASEAFGGWLRTECRKYGLKEVRARPWESLLGRVVGSR